MRKKKQDPLMTLECKLFGHPILITQRKSRWNVMLMDSIPYLNDDSTSDYPQVSITMR